MLRCVHHNNDDVLGILKEDLATLGPSVAKSSRSTMTFAVLMSMGASAALAAPGIVLWLRRHQQPELELQVANHEMLLIGKIPAKATLTIWVANPSHLNMIFVVLEALLCTCI